MSDGYDGGDSYDGGESSSVETSSNLPLIQQKSHLRLNHRVKAHTETEMVTLERKQMLTLMQKLHQKAKQAKRPLLQKMILHHWKLQKVLRMMNQKILHQRKEKKTTAFEEDSSNSEENTEKTSEGEEKTMVKNHQLSKKVIHTRMAKTKRLVLIRQKRIKMLQLKIKAVMKTGNGLFETYPLAFRNER